MDGKEDSIWKYFFNNGKLKETHSYKNGKNGSNTFYFSNGNLEQITVFKKDKEDSSWVSWFENGKMKTFDEYKNGKREGDAKIWDANGMLLNEGKFWMIKKMALK